MRPFAFSRASSIADAVEQGSADSLRFIAGGTNLLDLMKYDVERPRKLVDINRVPLAGIEESEGGGLRLGALVTNAQTAYDPRVQQRYPVLSSAILAGASAQLRNVATNGGNLNQRTRCYYFYNKMTACNKREPGSGCSAIGGVTRVHAILGTSAACIATHPSDMCVALAVLDATVQVTGAGGRRTIAIADYHRLPGDEPWLDNTLERGDLGYGDRAACGRLLSELYLSQIARQAVLCLRPCFRRGRDAVGAGARFGSADCSGVAWHTSPGA